MNQYQVKKLGGKSPIPWCMYVPGKTLMIGVVHEKGGWNGPIVLGLFIDRCPRGTTENDATAVVHFFFRPKICPRLHTYLCPDVFH